MKVAAYILAGWLLYEAVRMRVGKKLRENIPVIARAELRNRSIGAVGLLGPLLGTDAGSEVLGMVAQKTFYDTLPTLIGPRDYE